MRICKIGGHRQQAWCNGQHCFDCGVRVPDEVAVAGYDGSPDRHSCYSLLTTMLSDNKAIGTNSVEMLHKRISGQTGKKYQNIVIDPKLEIGTSA